MILLGLLFLALAVASAFLARTAINVSAQPGVDTGTGVLCFIGGYLLILSTLVLLGMSAVEFFAVR